MSQQSNVTTPVGSAQGSPAGSPAGSVASTPIQVMTPPSPTPEISIPNGQEDMVMSEVRSLGSAPPAVGSIQDPMHRSMLGSDGHAGSAVSMSPLEVSHLAIQRATENMSLLGRRLAQEQLAENEFNTVLAQYELASRGLNALMSGHQQILQSQSPSASASVSVERPSGTSRSSIVPADLPLLQWTGNIFDKSRTTFSSVQECLDRFEDIVESYSQDLDSSWCRLLPRMLSPDQRSWFVDHLKPHGHLPWAFAKKTIISKYGIQDAERQAQATQALFNLRMNRDESVERYTDRFHKIRREAGLEDSRVVAALFVNSLLPELSQHVSLGQAHLPADRRESTDQAANLARTLYSKVVLSRHDPRVAALEASVNLASSSSSAGGSGSSGAGGSPKAKDKKKAADSKFCRLHGKGKHSTDECRQVASLRTNGTSGGKVSKHSGSSSSSSVSSSGSASSSGKKCYKCSMPWSRGHTCSPVNHMAIRSATRTLSETDNTPPVTPTSRRTTAAPTPPTGSGTPVSTDLSSLPPTAVATATDTSAAPPSEDIDMTELEDALNDACSD